MIRPPLHRDVPPPHHPRHPFIQYHLHLPLEHDAVIQRLRPVHQRPRPRAEIHDPRHGPVGVDEPELLGREERVVRGQVRVAVQVGREARGRVHRVEGHGVVQVRRPGARAVGLDGGGARGRVAGDVVREAGEALGELGRVAGARGGHGGGVLVGGRWSGVFSLLREARGICYVGFSGPGRQGGEGD